MSGLGQYLALLFLLGLTNWPITWVIYNRAGGPVVGLVVTSY